MHKLGNGLYYDSQNHRIYRDDLPEQQRNADDEFHKLWKDRTAITKKGYARRIVLVLTNSCNLACSYCYAAQGGYGKECINKITQSQIMQMLHFLERQFPEGVGQIQFFGGEPLLEPKAIKYISSYMDSSPLFKETEKTMVTNGTVINTSVIEMLKKHNILVTISVDGTKKYHDLFRTFKINGAGSYSLIIHNIKRFLSAGIQTSIQFTINKQMVADYGKGLLNPEEIAESFAGLGISYIHLAPVIDTCNGEFAFDRYHKALLLRFQSDLMSAFRHHHIQDSKTVEAYSFLTRKLCNKGYCGAGLDEITIDINGDIYPCFMFINNEDFLLGDTINGITNFSLLEEIENNTKNKNKRCVSCPVKDTCNMCIGANYIENGDIHEPARTACAFHRNGYFKGVSQLVEDIDQ